jgi:hypothetical protein
MTAIPLAQARGGRIRPLASDDLEGIHRLHRECFGPGSEGSEGALRRHLTDLFFRHPWPDSRLPSLVYEDSAGDLTGCLGVMPRPMILAGRPIVAAVSHDFMVAPEHRGSLAAVELLRAFLAGPQDLSLAEGNDVSRRLWEALGGLTAIPYSFRWTRSLRPASHALARLGPGEGRWTGRALRPLARLADRAATRLARNPLRLERTDLEEEALEPAGLAEHVDRAAVGKTLRPVYDASSLDVVLGILDRCPGREPLRRAALRRDGAARGWYLYHPRRRGTGQVVQAGVLAGEGEVFDHLFRDARDRGSLALSGLLDPALLPSLSRRGCLFHRGRNAGWLLVHGRAERAVRALRQGDGYFTHLEGEFWV